MCCHVLAVVSMAILDPLIYRDPVNVDIEIGKIVAFHDYDNFVSILLCTLILSKTNIYSVLFLSLTIR